MNKSVLKTLFALCILAAWGITSVSLQKTQQQNDAIQGAQKPTPAADTRPEQNRSDHDRSSIFAAPAADPSSPVFRTQPNAGRITGFDFYRDPLNADHPLVKFEDIMKKESANKSTVMKAQ